MSAMGSVNLNPLDMAIAQEFITTDQFTQLLPARPVSGIQNRYRRETVRPNVAPHHIDGTVCESVGKFTTVTDEVGRIMAQPKLDVKVARMANLADAFREQLSSVRWELVDKWGYYLINGNGQTSPSSDDGEIKGLKVLADALPATQRYTPGTTTSGVALQFIHLDKLRKLLQYRPDFYLMTEDHLIDLKALFINLGGVAMPEVMRPFTVFEGDRIVIQNRPVPAYGGIPIFTSNHIQVESTNGATGKYRIYAGSFEEGKGLEVFYDQRNGAMGLEVEGIQMKEKKDDKFVRVRHMMGLSLRSTLSLACLVNMKITNT